jgi:hypothetical protein
MFRAEKSAPEISVLKYSFGPGSGSESEGGETLLAGRNNRKKLVAHSTLHITNSIRANR